MDIFDAVENGDVREIAKILRCDPSQARANQDGYTPLDAAMPDANIARILLRHGADVNVANKSKNKTPLHNATLSIVTTRLLIQHGADLNPRDRWGDTPLQFAADDATDSLFTPGICVAKLLVRSGAEYDMRPAIVMGDAKRVWDILKDDPKFFSRLNLSEHAELMYFASVGNSKVLKIMLEHGANPNAHTGEEGPVFNDPPIFIANPDNFELLLEFGADPNAPNSKGRIPLNYFREIPGAIKLLRAYGGLTSKQLANRGEATRTAQTKEGGATENGIHAAVSSEDARKVAAILRRDPDQINARDLNSEMPLHVAARYDMVAVMKTLLKHGAEIDAPGSLNEKTPLHCVTDSVHDSLRAARLLIQHGAALETRDRMGRTPLETAAVNSCGGEWPPAQAIVDLLLRSGAKYDIAFAIEVRDAKRVRDILRDQPDLISGLSGNAQADLMYIANLPIMKLLLEYGADPNASRAGDPDSIEPLLQVRDAQIAELLLKHGANPNVLDEGNTPLDIAKEEGYDDVAETLLKYGAMTSKELKAEKAGSRTKKTSSRNAKTSRGKTRRK